MNQAHSFIQASDEVEDVQTQCRQLYKDIKDIQDPEE